ncbi:HET-domain-containing protein [Mycena venus]|uniref:HET-domain-containing protein n=1 Tax=Mycena venus TaxID=2733690 RepID=A0A8H6X2A6_9AGAR|nr:HET-domain-containing protein [Mycena venus]
MSGECKESLTVIANLYGGTGGVGGVGGIIGGAAGTGEGAIMNINGVQSLTSNIVNQGQGLEEILVKWLKPPLDMDDRQCELRSLQHADTGHWLLTKYQFIKWKAVPGSLWIKGISGTGKSVLSSMVIQEITVACATGPKGSILPAVAYFFFDFRNKRQYMDSMLRTHVWDGPILPAVCICSEIGYLEGVHFLLMKHNTCVDQATKDGKTPLYLAWKNGHLDIVELLIKHNASVDQAIKYGWTMLHLASGNGHLKIVQLLIEHNASVDFTTGYGNTALHLALVKGHLHIARLLIEHNVSVNLATKRGWTALHLALDKGHLDIVKLLLEHNASINLHGQRLDALEVGAHQFHLIAKPA